MSERSDLTADEFVVKLADLPITKQVSLGAPFVNDAIGTMPMRAALERPADDPSVGKADARLELYEGSPGVFARGSIKGHLEVACSRCVEPVIVSIADDVAVSYLPAAEVPDDDSAPDDEEDEATVAEDDVDLYPYDGESIDLSRLFRERLIMAVPFAPLCSETCKGLCTVCGANLNEGDCGCDRHVGDPRLAALRDIKLSP